MSQMTAITLARRPTGTPVPEDFATQMRAMPEPGTGEVLVEVQWLSLDPYMRGRMDDVQSYAPSVGLGEVMTGQGVGRVLVSRCDGVVAGDLVTGITGWASHAVLAGAELRKLPDDIPPQAALGVLGMPGFTAWTGLRKYGRPQPAETLVVGAATGPVGSMVGQLAKAQGLRTVAVAGGADKCALALETFGFDAAVDHKAHGDARALRGALAQAAPDGIDIYWENVGNTLLEAIIPLMNTAGRIPLCGAIGWYGGAGADVADRLPMVWRSILVKRLHVSGFIIFDHWADFPEFLAEVAPKVAAGEITYLEDIAEGLAAAPEAFIGMLQGKNRGKQLVRLQA